METNTTGLISPLFRFFQRLPLMWIGTALSRYQLMVILYDGEHTKMYFLIFDCPVTRTAEQGPRVSAARPG